MFTNFVKEMALKRFVLKIGLKCLENYFETK